jgi:hypothetical protein
MSSPRRFLFIHVMKTGGTSFVFHLLQEFAPDEVYPSAGFDRRHATDAEPYGSIADLIAVTPERHAAIRMYAGHFPYMARELIGGDLTTLTLLRDPVDRTVSLLKHFKRLYERFHDAPFEQIYEDPFVFRHFIENHQTKVFSVNPDDHPRTIASRVTYQQIDDYVTSGEADRGGAGNDDTIAVDAQRFATARENLARVDVVGLNERFDEFVETLRARFGWWPAGMAGDARANVSSEAWEVGAALRARIARDNAFDVELYEYAKSLAP